MHISSDGYISFEWMKKIPFMNARQIKTHFILSQSTCSSVNDCIEKHAFSIFLSFISLLHGAVVANARMASQYDIHFHLFQTKERRNEIHRQKNEKNEKLFGVLRVNISTYKFAVP